jgi:hypothetical protein
MMSLARCARSGFARGQSYLMSLARCARSGFFAIPKFDEEPKTRCGTACIAEGFATHAVT